MPSLQALAAFALASVILIVIPGPSVLFVVGRSLSLGRRGGLLSVVGNELGGLPLVAAVAFGVGTIVAQSIALLTVVKVVGACYLAFLGIQAIRHRHDGAPSSGGVPARRTEHGWVLVRQGFLVGMTNPKTIVFFVAALPQFVDPRGHDVPVQMLALGILFLVIALCCDIVWALLAGTARSWFESSPRRLSRIRAGGGVMMIGLGGALALTGAKH